MSPKTDKIGKNKNTKLAPTINQKLGFINFILSPEQRKILESKNYLVQLYDTYKINYLHSYIKHLEKEDELLQENFPNVDFYRMARVKSKNNYIEKLRKKGEALDIFADKIIIVSVDGKTDEDLLVQTAYNMQNFLTSYSPNIQELTRKRKDYISAPKENGYASLHMTRAVYVEEFYQTQNEYFLPQYMHFEFDKTLRKNKIVLDSFDSNFKYYFGINFDDFILLQSVHHSR